MVIFSTISVGDFLLVTIWDQADVHCALLGGHRCAVHVLGYSSLLFCWILIRSDFIVIVLRAELSDKYTLYMLALVSKLAFGWLF